MGYLEIQSGAKNLGQRFLFLTVVEEAAAGGLGGPHFLFVDRAGKQQPRPAFGGAGACLRRGLRAGANVCSFVFVWVGFASVGQPRPPVWRLFGAALEEAAAPGLPGPVTRPRLRRGGR